jgi:hypothetical protein
MYMCIEYLVCVRLIRPHVHRILAQLSGGLVLAVTKYLTYVCLSRSNGHADQMDMEYWLAHQAD